MDVYIMEDTEGDGSSFVSMVLLHFLKPKKESLLWIKTEKNTHIRVKKSPADCAL